jgi:hypothetical protein
MFLFGPRDRPRQRRGAHPEVPGRLGSPRPADPPNPLPGGACPELSDGVNQSAARRAATQQAVIEAGSTHRVKVRANQSPNFLNEPQESSGTPVTAGLLLVQLTITGDTLADAILGGPTGFGMACASPGGGRGGGGSKSVTLDTNVRPTRCGGSARAVRAPQGERYNFMLVPYSTSPIYSGDTRWTWALVRLCP